MDNAASCHVTIADQYPVYVRARINECSRPVDVTFSIKVSTLTFYKLEKSIIVGLPKK